MKTEILPLRCVVAITLAQLHLTYQPTTDPNPARSVSEICNGENL